jgi:tRNA(Ile)-lysidine synthase
MHEKRGSGLRGKRGMSLLKGKILRPMLDISRSIIDSYVKAYNLAYRTDESNNDTSFERNHVRHKIIPGLKQDPGFENSIREKAKAARRKLEEVGRAKDKWLATHFKDSRLERQAFNQAGDDLKAEILLALLGQKDVYGKTLARLTDFIANGRAGKELTVKGRLFVIEYDRVRVASEEEKQPEPAEVKDEVRWGRYTIQVSNIKALRVRSWKPGDRFQPAGMKGTKKLQDFFTDAKIPKHEREQIPILTDQNDDIICIGNLRFSEAHKHLKENIRIHEK